MQQITITVQNWTVTTTKSPSNTTPQRVDFTDGCWVDLVTGQTCHRHDPAELHVRRRSPIARALTSSSSIAITATGDGDITLSGDVTG